MQEELEQAGDAAEVDPSGSGHAKKVLVIVAVVGLAAGAFVLIRRRRSQSEDA